MICGCGFAWSQVPGGGSQQDRPAQKETDGAKHAQPPTTTLQIQTAPAKQEPNADSRPPGYPWKELLAPANVPNWVLCVVGGFAGWAAFKTLKAIKRQADLMEQQGKDARQSAADASLVAQRTLDTLTKQASVMEFQAGQMVNQTLSIQSSVSAAQASADAANSQIKLMKDKERARIQVKPIDFDTVYLDENKSNYMTIEFLNLGPTHALNVRAEGDGWFTVKDFDPQEFELTDLVLPPVLRPNSPETSWVPLVFEGKAGEEVRNMKAKIFIEMMGSVEYEDVFGESHKTTFHYRMFVYGWTKSAIPGGTTKMKRMGGWSNTGPTEDNHAS
jgi:hypothetical protein